MRPTASQEQSSLQRADVRDVLARLHRNARGDYLRLPLQVPKLAMGLLRGKTLTDVLKEGAARQLYLPVSPEQGRFLYLVARTLGARTIVEFGTSFGISTLYLAAAVADNGGGKVIGTELEPNKQAVATDNLAAAGFGDIAEVRLGDALETLRDIPAPVDMVLLDGWKDLYMPVLDLLRPKLRRGSVVLADNIFTFKKALRPFVDHLQSGKNGFQSTTLSIADGFEYAYYEGP